VAELACAIAGELGLPKDQVEGIQVAALLHDIGKVTVPSEILTKPGELSPMEFELIKTHAAVGADILEGIDFSWPVAKIVRQHHERLDGSGYPQGLKDDEILLEARIIGVADVVEAMASHRPYRPARGITKALKEIKKNKDVLYDPQVVEACVKLFEEGRFKFHRLNNKH
jgi:putative nucleotidyltransferase with HDIG domain